MTGNCAKRMRKRRTGIAVINQIFSFFLPNVPPWSQRKWDFAKQKNIWRALRDRFIGVSGIYCFFKGDWEGLTEFLVKASRELQVSSLNLRFKT